MSSTAVSDLFRGAIPADRVLGIGEYALTIQQPDDISDIVKIPAAIELMQKNITVSGTRVLTKKGSLLGETGDFYVNDDNTYNITGVEFVPVNDSMPSGIIPRSSIITFGKDLLVVQDDFIDQLIESPHSIEDESSEEEKKIFSLNLQSPVSDEEITPSVIISQEPEEDVSEEIKAEEETETEKEEILNIDSIYPDTSFQIPFEKSEEETVLETEQESEEEKAYEEEFELKISSELPAADDTKEEHTLSAAELFEQRQRQYLAGKKVTKTIYSSDGQVIINNGDIITDQLIDEVKAHGKLIELVMNYEE